MDAYVMLSFIFPTNQLKSYSKDSAEYEPFQRL